MDRQRLSSVIKVSQDISSILNLDTLLEIVMGKAIEVTGAQRGILFIYDEKSQALAVKAYQGVERLTKAEYSTGIVNQAFEKDMVIITTNAEKDERLLQFESVRADGPQVDPLRAPQVPRQGDRGLLPGQPPLRRVFSHTRTRSL